jgi:hypothetical protein
MSLARAEYARSNFGVAWWFVATHTDTEPVRIFKLKFPLEVDETMEMISAIQMALSTNDVLAAKECDKSDKICVWPLRARLTESEQEPATDPTWFTCCQPSSWDSDAREFFDPKVGGDGERVVGCIHRRLDGL